MILKDGKYNVGIDSQYMNHFVHAQKRDQLCWAASIQTILKFYGIFVSQEDIVIRTFGIQPDGVVFLSRCKQQIAPNQNSTCFS